MPLLAVDRHYVDSLAEEVIQLQNSHSEKAQMWWCINFYEYFKPKYVDGTEQYV